MEDVMKSWAAQAEDAQESLLWHLLPSEAVCVLGLGCIC